MAYSFEEWANTVDANFQPYGNKQGPEKSPPWTTPADGSDGDWLREPFDVAMSTISHGSGNFNVPEPGARQGSGHLPPTHNSFVNKQVSRISDLVWA
jgi:hypothetical protein